MRLSLLLTSLVALVLGQPGYAPAQRGKRGQPVRGVYKAQVTPHWFADNTRFWYRNDLRGGTREFVLVDAVAGTRALAFDHDKLAKGLSKAAGASYVAEKLPFDGIEFVEKGNAIRVVVAGTTWRCDLTSYECAKVDAKSSPPAKEDLPGPVDDVGQLESPWPDGYAPDADRSFLASLVAKQRGGAREARSPEGDWTAFVKNHDVYVRDKDAKERQLSKDGKEGLAYGMLSWSPDSKTLAAFRIEPGDRKEVHLIESSPRGGGRAVLRSRPYPLPGDKFTAHELNLFDVTSGKQVKPNVDRVDFGFPRLRWSRDGKRLSYEKTDRGHQRFRIVEVEADSGKARDLVDEQTKTFIWTAHTERRGGGLTYLDKTDEVLYASERD